MSNDEQKLIENLFSRLYQTEIKTSNRDNVAEQLIKDLLKKHPNSPYYMAQTILIQETAIKKLNEKISLLNSDNNIKTKEDKKNISGGFLSNLFGTKKAKHSSNELSSDRTSNNLKDQVKDSHLHSFPTQSRTSITPQGGIVGSNSNGFLSGALQTAAGVAGGVVMANMLMNLFQHKKPEEEIMDAASAHNIGSFHDVNPNSLENDSVHNQHISGGDPIHKDDDDDDDDNDDNDDDNDDDDSYQPDCDSSVEDNSDSDDASEDDDFI
ncbi:MAG: DUF2076 domain-containing protein [Buchnera aphidicola (Nurudea shiraii)]